ncbi:uncharacterized protein LOC131842803 [Achroia grisella]|uniref:uncharacterized protein LOC131842803 n=1 Tax=Achroia grisella TaxID=688607 RepID=UPI0027D2343E|nr:uncharacterized protein LOC131842803 [Achroia grisella]
MGDFNTDLLRDTHRSLKLRTIVESASFSVLPLGPTHTNTDSPDTWIDQVFVSSNESVLKHGHFPAPGFSRHDLICATYNIKTLKPKPAVIRLRNFSRVDLTALSQEVTAVDWSYVLSASCINDKVAAFNHSVLKIMNKHAPAHLVRVKRQPAPWITEVVRIAMRKRDRTFRILE